jgi:hypothetical protein
MTTNLFEATRVAAYFIWEYTQNDHAMSHWCCAEDFSLFLSCCGYTSAENFEAELGNGRYTPEYEYIVRHLAYRLYVYTNNGDELTNWYAAERLLENAEWRNSVLEIASVFMMQSLTVPDGVQSDVVRRYYEGKV